MAHQARSPEILPADNLDVDEVYPEDLLFRIRAKAKELYASRGRQHGRDWEDWIEAERIVREDMARQRRPSGG